MAKQPGKKRPPRAARKRAPKPPLTAARESVDSVIELCQEVSSGADRSLEKLRKLAAESGRLEEIFRSIREGAQEVERGAIEQDEGLAALRAAAPAVARVESAEAEAEITEESFSFRPEAAAKPGKEFEDLKLENFFNEVSSSVISAQKKLDIASVEYSRNLQGSVPPAFYSIPNVKAEVKLGFTLDDSSNILVKLFGDPEDKSRYGESTVSFDVVSGPPPPGFTHAPEFLVMPPERDSVFAAVNSILPAIQQQAGIALAQGRWEERAVVFRKDQAYIVIVPGDAMLVCRLSIAKPEQALAFPVAGDQRTRDALSDIAAGIREWERTSFFAPAGK
jgi:hypothetical protein